MDKGDLYALLGILGGGMFGYHGGKSSRERKWREFK